MAAPTENSNLDRGEPSYPKPDEHINLAPYYPATIYPHVGEYIVTLKEGYTIAAHLETVPELQNNDYKDLEYVKFQAYFASMADELFLKVRQDPGVKSVHQAGGMKLDEDIHPISSVEQKNTTQIFPELYSPQDNPNYGLIYISGGVKYPNNKKYDVIPNSGQGFDIYIVDSGITTSAAQFQSRIVKFKDYTGTEFADTINHGTSVAACAGAKSYGTSKRANLVIIKFAPSAGNLPEVLADIRSRHASRKADGTFKGSVINMSFSVDSNQANIEALEATKAAGITMVASAGNDGVSSTQFPCIAGEVICVAASNNVYQRWSSSNYGPNVDFFAPGENILTLYNNKDDHPPRSGTSFSTPYVAGVIAIFGGYLGQSMTPEKAQNLLTYNQHTNFLSGLPADTINAMVSSGYNNAPAGEPFIMS